MKIIRIVFIFLWIAVIFGAVPDLAEAKKWACTTDFYSTNQCSGSPYSTTPTCQDSDLKGSCTPREAGTYYKISCIDCGDVGCSETTGKCNPPAIVQTTPSISLSTDFKSVPADVSTALTITASLSDKKSNVHIVFTSDKPLYYVPESKTTCYTGEDGTCSITVTSGTVGTTTITAKATTVGEQPGGIIEYKGDAKITFTEPLASCDSEGYSRKGYLGLIEFSPSSPQVNEEVTARSAFGSRCNGKSFLLKEGTCEGRLHDKGCTVKDGKCSATFRPDNGKTYDLRFCDGNIDTKHAGTLTVGSLVTLKITRAEGHKEIVTLTDKFDFAITFPEWPGDKFKITIQYSTDGGAQFKNLKNWEGKEIGSSAFARNGKTITASIVVADNDLKAIGEYLFRVVPTQVGSGVPSNVASIKFEAKCKRGNPTIEFTSEPAPIKVPFGKEVKPDKPLEFKFRVKNNDEERCKLFDSVFSDFGVKAKDFCVFKPDKKEGEKDSCGFDLKNVKLTPAKRQALPFPLSSGVLATLTDIFTLTVDIGPQSYPTEFPTKTFYVILEAEHLNIEEIWKQKANIDGKSERKAEIKVERGGRACKHDFPLVYVKNAGGRGKELDSPRGELVLPGETLTYEAFVFNRDFAECGPSTFKFDSIDLPTNEKEEKGRWELTHLLHVAVPSQIKPADIKSTKDDIEFTIEGCPEGKTFNECPYKSFKFNLKSDPETKQGEYKDFKICFKNVNSDLTSCRLPDEKFKNKFDELNTVYKNWDTMAVSLPSRIHSGYAGSCGSRIIKDNPKENCDFLVSVLPKEDKIPPKIGVRLSPEKPYPGGKVKFLITTSDNVQMKQIKLAIDKGFIKEDIPLKDPEEHVTIHEGGPFVKRDTPHNYYAIAKDWKHEEGNIKDNIACFPEQPDKTCPDPNSAKILKEFDIEDNPDLIIDDINWPAKNPTAGEDLPVTIKVKNLGTVNLRSVYVNLHLFNPGSFTPTVIPANPIEVGGKVGVAAKDSKDFKANIPKGYIIDGISLIRATVTSDETEPKDADETNNVLIKYLVVRAKPEIRISGRCNLGSDCEITVAGICTNGKLSVAPGDTFDAKNVKCQLDVQGKATIIRWSGCGGSALQGSKKIFARATCNEGQSNDLNVLDDVAVISETGKGAPTVTACSGKIGKYTFECGTSCEGSNIETKLNYYEIEPEAKNSEKYKCTQNTICCVKYPRSGAVTAPPPTSQSLCESKGKIGKYNFECKSSCQPTSTHEELNLFEIEPALKDSPRYKCPDTTMCCVKFQKS